MSPIWIAFFTGMLIGFILGMFILGLCVAARESDDEAKLYRSIAEEIRKKNCSINP